MLLPPTSRECYSDVLYSNNCQLDSSVSTSHEPECFEILNDCLTPTDGSIIDFLGCCSYLKSLDHKMSLLYLKSLEVYIVRSGAAAGLFSVQAHNWKGPPRHQTPPKALGPLPIDAEPPPRKCNHQEQSFLLNFMFLIIDENFSFKSLRRFKHKVVSFLTYFFLTLHRLTVLN